MLARLSYAIRTRNHTFLSLVIMLVSLTACGDKRPTNKTTGAAMGKIEAVFELVAKRHQIPKKILLAVALNESAISPIPASATYINRENALGFTSAETAFGISFAKLGLTNDVNRNLLETQIDAYARWLRNNLDQKHLELNPNPVSTTDTYDWIWNVAQMHRGGNEARRNVQVIFAYELIATLNAGAIWQDATTGEILRLPAENPQINVDSMEKHVKDTLFLLTDDSDIFTAQYFELSYQQTSESRNVPNHVKVIHCPFSLSACLELQNVADETDEVRLNAHYVIPIDNTLVKKPLQIAQHKDVAFLTNTYGDQEALENAIVIMLVGESGRYVNGERMTANPKWFTKYQLTKMGSIARNICSLLQKSNDKIDLNRCMTPDIEGGVQFIRQRSSTKYQWGDIPDFDESIFWTYIATPDLLSGDVEFQFDDNKQVFAAGQAVKFQLKFIKGTAKIVIEHLERCSNGKVIWSVVQQHRTRNVNAKRFDDIIFYSKGINGNGQHFFRSMVYGPNNDLMGWAIEDIYLTNFDKDSTISPSIKECERYGT